MAGAVGSFWFYTVMAAVMMSPEADCHVTEHLVRDGASIFLDCHDGGFDHGATAIAQSLSYQWILPSGDALIDQTTKNVSAKYALFQRGSILQINNAGRSDAGLYLCLVLSDNSSQSIIHVSKHGINSRSPLSGDLLSQYATRIQYGVAAGIVVLVVMAMVCYNYDRHQKQCGIEPGGRSESASVERQNSFTTQIKMNEGFKEWNNEAFQVDSSDHQSGEKDGCANDAQTHL